MAFQEYSTHSDRDRHISRSVPDRFDICGKNTEPMVAWCRVDRHNRSVFLPSVGPVHLRSQQQEPVTRL